MLQIKNVKFIINIYKITKNMHLEYSNNYNTNRIRYHRIITIRLNIANIVIIR